MASSGSFTTSSRGATQYPRNATFNWWQTGQSIDGNYTDIAWNFVLGGGTSNNATIAIYAGSITVNGATTNFNYGGAFKKNGFVLASGSSRIYHNADGTKAFNANGGVNIYGSSQWYGGSQDFWLNTIPRASTPSLTNANFNIGDTITINTNRASSSFTHTVKIKYGSSTTTIATGVGASVTYNTSNIADALYALIPNDKKYTGGTIELTTYNGGTVIGTKSCAYTANAVASAASPLFSNFTYADTNSATTAITGNSAVLISGKSTLAVTISAANKATARKSATMKKYTYQIAGLTGEANYSTSQIVKNMGSPEVAQTELPSGTRDLVVTAVDSRGYSTAVTKRVTIVPYKAPTISASASRLNGFEAETTIKIAGTFSRIEVGGTAKNTVDASSGVQYRYKAQNTTTWGSWTNKTATIDAANGKVTVADFKLSLDNQNAYDFEVRITDRLQTATGSFKVAVGQPAFYIGADGRVGVGGMPTKSKNTGEAGLMQVMGRIFADNLYPVGSIYMTTTMTSASQVNAALGGTWVAWGAGRVPVGVNASETEFNAVEKTGGSKYLQNHNHDLRWASSTGRRVLMSHKSGSTSAFDLSWQSITATLVDDNIMTGQPKNPTSNKALTTGTAGNLQPYITCYMYKRTA